MKINNLIIISIIVKLILCKYVKKDIVVGELYHLKHKLLLNFSADKNIKVNLKIKFNEDVSKKLANQTGQIRNKFNWHLAIYQNDYDFSHIENKHCKRKLY